MKKAILLIFTLCILVLGFCFTAGAITCDVDADGSVTAADARLVLRYSVGLERLTGEALREADPNFDAMITAADARYILRMSVGLEKAPLTNEYEILRSGNFRVKGELFDASGATGAVDLTVTKDGFYMISEFNGIEIGMLISDGKYYMVSEDREAVLELSESVMTMAGISLDELASDSFIDFSEYPAFDELESLGTEMYKSELCTVYCVKTAAEYTEIYMRGERVVRLMCYTSDGTFIGDFDIYHVGGAVDEKRTEVPEDYKFYTGISGMFKFMSVLGL